MRALLLLLAIAAATSAQHPDEHILYLRNGPVSTSGLASRLSAASIDSLRSAVSAVAIGEKEHSSYSHDQFYVRYDEPSAEPASHPFAIRQELEKLGATVLAAIPDHSFLVAMSAAPQSVAAIEQLNHISWVRRVDPSHKFDDRLIWINPDETDQVVFKDRADRVRSVAGGVPEVHGIKQSTKEEDFKPLTECSALHRSIIVPGYRRLTLQFSHRSQSLSEARSLLRAWTRGWQQFTEQHRPAHAGPHSLLVCHTSPSKASLLVREPVLREAVAFLAHQPHVHWLENLPRRHLYNSDVTWITQTATLNQRKIWNKGITGRGQLIAVGDTGLDFSHCFFLDQSFNLSSHYCADCRYADLQHGPCKFTSPDCTAPNNHRKVAAYWSFSDGVDFYNGHGTHIAGTVAGGVPAYLDHGVGSHNGTAPEARIVFTDLSNSTTGLDGPVIDIPPGLDVNYFPFSYAMGARIHSNSWGTAGIGYDTETQEIDSFMYHNPDYLVLFAAGNRGNSGIQTVPNEAEAKNILTVGASGSSPTHMGDANTAAQYEQKHALVQIVCTPSLFEPYCASIQALANSTQTCTQLSTYFCNSFQLRSNYCCAISSALSGPEYGLAQACSLDCCITDVQNANYYTTGLDARISAIAYFSGQGPTHDGRIKPDLVAPGNPVVSARALGDYTNGMCVADPDSTHYAFAVKGDTSSATAATAGSMALIRQYFTDGYATRATQCNLPDPGGLSKFVSSALLKAMAINSAVDIFDLSFRSGVSNGGRKYQSRVIGNNSADHFLYGYGRIRLDQVLRFFNDSDSNIVPFGLEFHDKPNTTGVGNFEFHDYTITVPVADPSRPLKITLVWTDPPATTFTFQNSVNQLELAVMGPDGVLQRGNQYLGLSSQFNRPNAGVFDSVNTVKSVIVPNQAGVFNVRVFGASVVTAQQGYALVATYPVSAPSSTPFFKVSAWGPCDPATRTQTRSVVCGTADGCQLPIAACAGLPVPSTISSCKLGFHYDAVSDWSVCSPVCGPGQQTRTVGCYDSHDLPVPSYLCANSTAIPVQQNCNARACHIDWLTSAFNETCNPCSTPILTRRVYCWNYDLFREEDASLCTNPAPPASEPCPKTCYWTKFFTGVYRPSSLSPCNANTECCLFSSTSDSLQVSARNQYHDISSYVLTVQTPTLSGSACGSLAGTYIVFSANVHSNSTFTAVSGTAQLSFSWLGQGAIQLIWTLGTQQPVYALQQTSAVDPGPFTPFVPATKDGGSDHTGLIVGVVIGVLAAAAAVVLGIRYYRRRAQSSESGTSLTNFDTDDFGEPMYQRLAAPQY